MIFEEFAEVAVVVFAHRLVERERLAGHAQDVGGFVERKSGRDGGFFDRRLHAFILDQLARGIANFAHGFDHVDRHADRAALVGDCPGNGLANPPRGVGRKFVTAGVFELIDRPHQTGVAFLNQIQEAQAAVAIAFGDRYDQPQISGGKISFGGFVFLVQRGDAIQTAAERGGAFQRHPHQIAQFLAEFHGAGGVVGIAARFGQLLFDGIHSLRDLLEFFEHRLQTLRPQAEFFDQPDGFHSALQQAPPCFAAFFSGMAIVDRPRVKSRRLCRSR